MIYSSAFARFSVDSLAIKLPSVDVNVFIFLSRQSARHFVPKRSGKIGTSIYRRCFDTVTETRCETRLLPQASFRVHEFYTQAETV